MNDNALELMSIEQLRGYVFHIPYYQRGYRWTPCQVTDLLEDISRFVPRPIDNSEAYTWYCLQPLVVRRFHLPGGDREQCGCDTWYEVIDGQQRLTTIYLIRHFLNRRLIESEREALFTLDYETRPGSALFLENELADGNIVDTNIDFHHISLAYQTICDWFKVPEHKYGITGFEKKFLESTKVIWYESKEADPIAIFTRINMGKIPLTNAELIKALFLNSSNFKEADAEKVRLKQLEIAGEWDRMEYALQDEGLWYFINEADNNLDTRIEYLFDLMAGKPSDEEDEFFTFKHFSRQFQACSKEDTHGIWQEIKRYYQTIDDWYRDRELYHKIGFLVTTGDEVTDLVARSWTLTKTDFRRVIDGKIAEKVDLKLDELEYGTSGNNRKIRQVLLFHNIQTMLDNSRENSRFPFDRYKNENWDIEHIHSVMENMPKSVTHQKEWLEDVYDFIKDDALKLRAKAFDKDSFKDLYEDIVNSMSADSKHEDINDISNLALLDARTNRGYKNAVFPVKRHTIIDRDRNGTFIPPCTRNVFLKYYSKNATQLDLWNHDDRNCYIVDIKRAVDRIKSKKGGANHGK
jgi:uncharacterized protein with ParB-like and HNH nuclease domain